jgi:hypothetical protein
MNIINHNKWNNKMIRNKTNAKIQNSKKKEKSFVINLLL